MFDVKSFSNILQKITNTYTSISEFAEKSEVNRTYLSKYINMKLNNPPTPKILEKIANASNGIISYNELMEICGYINRTSLSKNTYPCITDKEWKEIFGTDTSIKLTDNEAIVWAEMLEKIPTSNKVNLGKEKISIDYDLNDYCKRATSINEEKMITELFFFFMLLVCKKIGTSKDCEKIMNVMRQQKIIDSNNPSLNIHKENNALFNIPVLGKIAAGRPILAEEHLEGYLPVDPNVYGMTTPDDYFYLKVSGESMNLKVHNGDYALIHKQDTAEDGDIVVAIVNGDDEATLKKYKRISEETVALEPMSTLPMEPIYVNLKETNFKIIGKAIGQFGKF